MFQAHEEASFATMFTSYSSTLFSTLTVAEDQAGLDAYLDDVRTLLMEGLKEEDVCIVYYPITRAVGLL
jgi:hypothetical protein